jgi:hypothetical protein
MLLRTAKRFFTPRPISTVAVSDPRFELRMWRGPVWNSITYWAARAAIRYNRPDAAHKLLEPALDDTAAQFTRTGKLWEFYSPFAGHPEDLKRKPETSRNAPFPDYLGHNPPPRHGPPLAIHHPQRTTHQSRSPPIKSGWPIKTRVAHQEPGGPSFRSLTAKGSVASMPPPQQPNPIPVPC